jgi:anti-sigma factor RsiW
VNCADIAALAPLYLSGELEAPRRVAFAEHLEACAACAREIEHQAEVDRRLRAGVLAEHIDSAAVDGRVRREIAAAPAGPARWRIAATVAAALLVAVAAYRTLSSPAIPRVCTDAAQDHRLEVVDHQRRPWITDQAAIAKLASAQGLAGSVEALGSTGYRLERGKLCRLDGRAFLHLIYTDGSREFSVFLRKSAGHPVNLYTADAGRQYLASFDTNRLTAVVVTDQSRDAAVQIGRFAESVL